MREWSVPAFGAGIGVGAATGGFDGHSICKTKTSAGDEEVEEVGRMRNGVWDGTGRNRKLSRLLVWRFGACVLLGVPDCLPGTPVSPVGGWSWCHCAVVRMPTSECGEARVISHW